MTAKSLSVALSAALVASSVTVSTPAGAQTASGMSDLIGARGSSLEFALQSRGYAFAQNKGAASMWWNERRSSCVSTLVDNGRVASIQRASADDCGKDPGSRLVGVAIGAAAAGLIAALAAHHHGQTHRNNNEEYNRRFERGYNDAMGGSPYSRHDSEAYHAGYMAGEAERSSNRRRGAGDRERNTDRGRDRDVRIADIKGMDGVRAFDELRSRGFEGVDTITSGSTLYGIYYHRRSGLCVQTTSADNRILDIRDIQTHPKCR